VQLTPQFVPRGKQPSDLILNVYVDSGMVLKVRKPTFARQNLLVSLQVPLMIIILASF